jgi:hypothetical protein
LLPGVEDIRPKFVSAASAAVAALEYHCNRIKEPPTNLSTAFVHYNARIVAGKEGQDVGTTIDAALSAIVKYGACRNETWPYDATKINARPPQHAYDEAQPGRPLRSHFPEVSGRVRREHAGVVHGDGRKDGHHARGVG